MNNVISWNVNSFFSKYPFIQLLLKDFNPSVFCVQESKLLPSHSLFLKNYTTYRQDNSTPGNAKGGVLIAVSKHYHSEHLTLTTPYQSVAVRVWFDSPITFCSIYLHHQDLISVDLLHDLIKQLPQPLILTGDFNAHSEMWHSSHTDTRGAVIESLLNSSHIALLNTGQPTRFNIYSGEYTAIDLTLCSTTLVPKTRWSMLDQSYTSDHLPQRIEILSSTSPFTFRPSWKYEQADWDAFTSMVNFSGIESCTNATEMATLIENQILEAARETIPQTTPSKGKYRVPWWDQNCTTAIKTKRHAWRTYNRHPTAETLTGFKIARARARRVLYEARRTHWRNYISKINSQVPPTILWKRIRSIANKQCFEPIPALRNDRGELLTSADDIAQNFSNFYGSNTYTDTNINTDDIPSPNIGAEDPHNRDIQLDEVKEAVKHQRNTAAGPDQIHATMLKHLNIHQLKHLTLFFNHIWTKNDFPTQWRLAHIIPLRKPGKDATRPESYRPISLTNVLCKILERTVVKRMHNKLAEIEKMDRYQSGFKPGKSTIDSLVLLSQEIQTGYAQKQHTIGVFFDIEKAFDRIRPTSILYALQDLGLGGNTYYFVRNFLKDRFFQVRVGQTLSTETRQLTGTPQGSVLSPLLFILAINNIKNFIQYPVHHLLYADDLVLFARGADLQDTQKQLQYTINSLATWANSHGLSFAPAKTKIIAFSKKRHLPPIQLSLNGATLEQTSNIKFLGLIFDSTLTWRQHIQELQQKCTQRLNLLKTLNGTTWGADKKCLLHLYQSHIRSVLDYGSIIYSSASTSNFKKLDTVQNQALRIATGAFRTSPIASINTETNIMPLAHHRNVKILNYYGKLLITPDHINSYRGISSTHPGSLRYTVLQLLQEYQLTSDELAAAQSFKSQRKIIQKAVRTYLQHQWTSNPHPFLLRTIKPQLENWSTSFNSSRRLERAITRIRIGHTHLTHNHLILRTDPPHCNSCQTTLTLLHLLNDCIEYTPQRIKAYGKSPFNIYSSLRDDKKKLESFFMFLKDSQLISKI